MNDTIRILHYIGSLESGGSQAMVMNIYRNIDRNKVQFDFIIHSTDDTFHKQEIEKMGAQIYVCPQYNGKNHFTYIKWWKDFFNEHKEYKIFHCHVRSTSSLCLSLSKRLGLYSITHSHNTSNGVGINAVVKNIIQFPTRFIADYFFACSKEAGKWMFGNKIIKSNKFKILNNSIETNKYIFNSVTRDKYRKQLNIEDKFVIGTVGRFVLQKNPYFIIEILKELKKITDDFVFLWIGSGVLHNAIENEIKSNNLQYNVIMAGTVYNVYDYLQAIDVFVLPSLWEGLGIVAIESQAAGLKTICSDTIPKETKVTDLIEYISLNKSAQYWAKRILECKDYYRINQSDSIRKAGYDIIDSANFIQEFYIEKEKKYDF